MRVSIVTCNLPTCYIRASRCSNGLLACVLISLFPSLSLSIWMRFKPSSSPFSTCFASCGLAGDQMFFSAWICVSMHTGIALPCCSEAEVCRWNWATRLFVRWMKLAHLLHWTRFVRVEKGRQTNKRSSYAIIVFSFVVALGLFKLSLVLITLIEH